MRFDVCREQQTRGQVFDSFLSVSLPTHLFLCLSMSQKCIHSYGRATASFILNYDDDYYYIRGSLSVCFGRATCHCSHVAQRAETSRQKICGARVNNTTTNQQTMKEKESTYQETVQSSEKKKFFFCQNNNNNNNIGNKKKCRH